ncbi:Bcr/CflA family drug resistance efflux transporter [Ktedonobacter sp. SOSP1-85]|uniref:multidrug effflux MFS transporter n=1 Tax=Ktedonobacter sp. SOSP1-85 TaxID=2778367 RepID=UPI001A19D397|nr:multidrug effflux MFS transporter [Ktedonobacter sp. SOSP1-85]GHO80576.1 Bcr/CflA family drug resistance efflux transporter [Ktedonobacter sp. SOSP1-85]
MMAENILSIQPDERNNVLSTTDAQVDTQKQGEKPSARIRARHVLLLGGLGALGPLANDMYVPSLPTLSRDLAATTSQAQLTLSAFILGLALGQIVAGPISDARGRRWPLLIGIAVYVLTSLLCAIAPSMAILIPLRFIQGVAGAAGVALALAMVSDLYSGIAQARFFSLLMQINGLAPMLAPLLGGQLLRVTSWHGIFVTLALAAVLLFAASALGLGETLPVSQRQRGGITTTLSAFRELLLNRRFVGYALSCGFAFTACIIYISVSPFVLQNIYGISPQLLGIIFGINALGIVIMAQVNARLVGRVPSQHLLSYGYAMIALGGVTLLVVVLSGIGLIGILPAFFILTSSLGLIMPNATTLAMANTRAAGSAAALLGVLQLAIGAVVAPLVGLGGSASALPMAASIAAFALATLLTFILLCRPARA